MKMTRQDFELRHASIYERWESRIDQATGDAEAVKEANAWRIDQLAQLYNDSGWTLEEIGASFAEFMAKHMSRNGSSG